VGSAGLNMRQKFVDFIEACRKNNLIEVTHEFKNEDTFYFWFVGTDYFFTVILKKEDGQAWFWSYGEHPFSLKKESRTKSVELDFLLEHGPKKIQDFISFNIDIFGYKK
jgi:hypothetical protein